MEGKMRRLEFTRHMHDLLDYAKYNNIPVIVDYVKRSYEEQKRLVAEGKSKTLKSRHLQGKAVDLYIVNDRGTEVLWPKKDKDDLIYKLYKILGGYWESKGNNFRWGGNFDKDGNPLTGFFDPYHFEAK